MRIFRTLRREAKHSVENYLGIFWKKGKIYGTSTNNCQQKGRAKRAPLLLRQFFFVLFPYFLQFFQKMAQVVFHSFQTARNIRPVCSARSTGTLPQKQNSHHHVIAHRAEQSCDLLVMLLRRVHTGAQFFCVFWKPKFKKKLDYRR